MSSPITINHHIRPSPSAEQPLHMAPLLSSSLGGVTLNSAATICVPFQPLKAVKITDYCGSRIFLIVKSVLEVFECSIPFVELVTFRLGVVANNVFSVSRNSRSVAITSSCWSMIHQHNAPPLFNVCVIPIIDPVKFMSVIRILTGILFDIVGVTVIGNHLPSVGHTESM